MTNAQCEALDRLEALAQGAHAVQTWSDEATPNGPRVHVRWSHADGRVELAEVDQWGIIGTVELEHTARTDRTLRGQAQAQAAERGRGWASAGRG